MQLKTPAPNSLTKTLWGENLHSGCVGVGLGLVRWGVDVCVEGGGCGCGMVVSIAPQHGTQPRCWWQQVAGP